MSCETFEGLGIGAWDTSSVTLMLRLFENCERFDADLSAWDTSSATDMGEMFYCALSFSHDISTWNTVAVRDHRGMFATRYEPTSGYIEGPQSLAAEKRPMFPVSSLG